MTKEGESKSRWDLPEYFKDVEITYHTNNSWKDNYFQSASKGQEFIINANNKIINWTKRIISSGMNLKATSENPKIKACDRTESNVGADMIVRPKGRTQGFARTFHR